MNTPEPTQFADRWVEAWNVRDVEAVLTHFADDVVFTSPTATRFVPESGGTIRGKVALRRYWTLALQANPGLHFELMGVYVGIETVVLHYRTQLGGLVNEVLTFRDGLVAVGHATHLQP
ncbi:MAG: nuclear transport factor 2 family protein [Actinomycetota bacterium]|nr:nuclear transport factor 2 family protein [Actinomycetota bacterium]